MCGKFFSHFKGTRIGVVSFARRNQGTREDDSWWEKKRYRGKGREEDRLAHAGGLAGSKVRRERGDC